MLINKAFDTISFFFFFLLNFFQGFNDTFVIK